jgi:hypothetical protein
MEQIICHWLNKANMTVNNYGGFAISLDRDYNPLLFSRGNFNILK